ncbi:unnamed protein product [Paramecium sonneborni]|uniref:Uncharacterized protein n=1 Tax=Paramecium sonneborni TaxID=65129 RepID=A0A8S1QGI7_9CILI|nr:unnamed protein product [Paramecium sonneborni]
MQANYYMIQQQIDLITKVSKKEIFTQSTLQFLQFLHSTFLIIQK